MKFVAFVDLHQDLVDFDVVKNSAKDADFILCLGDFTIFGSDQDKMLAMINKLGKKVYLIHGNHEDASEVKQDCAKYQNVEFVHKKMIEIDGKLFVFHGGGGFSSREHAFKHWITKNKDFIKKHHDIILATHAPPEDTLLDAITDDWHVGVKDYTDFIKDFKPVLAVSGHIHESYKQQQVLGETLVVNPGGDGELFEID